MKSRALGHDGNQGGEPFKIRRISGPSILQTMEEDLGDVIEEGDWEIFLHEGTHRKIETLMPRGT